MSYEDKHTYQEKIDKLVNKILHFEDYLFVLMKIGTSIYKTPQIKKLKLRILIVE